MTMSPANGAAAERPLLSVSIVSHGNALETSALLDSLLCHERAHLIQLILTANLGNDLPQLDLSAWHSVTVLRNERPRSFASNHNAAFRHACAEAFCLLNPDIVLLEPVFERLLGHIHAGRADILAPLAIDSQGQVQDSFRPLPTPIELFKRRALKQIVIPAIDPDQLIAPDWIAGFFQIMPASLYARLEGMDENFRLYMEDVDFCTRARLLGYKVAVDPGIRFQHEGRRASRDEVRYFLWHLGSALRFFTSSVYRRGRAIKS